MSAKDDTEPREASTRQGAEAAPDAEAALARSADRRVVATAAVLLLGCGVFVGYSVLNTDDEPKPRPVPTAEVTYQVLGEGKADISYLARSEAGKVTVVPGAELPWRKTVRVPLGKNPIVSVTLGKKGGRASCTLAVRGRHVQRATAFGSFGRANCTGELPAPPVAPRPPSPESRAAAAGERREWQPRSEPARMHPRSEINAAPAVPPS